jgi:hypothetical protein
LTTTGQEQKQKHSIKCQNYTRPELDKLHKHAINLEVTVVMYSFMSAVNLIHGHCNYFRVLRLMMTVLQFKHVQFVIQTSISIHVRQLISSLVHSNILSTQPR